MGLIVLALIAGAVIFVLYDHEAQRYPEIDATEVTRDVEDTDEM